MNRIPGYIKNILSKFVIEGAVAQKELDKLGRAVIPNSLLSKYNISKEVMVLGAGDHIEVWDAKAYKEYESSAESNFEEIAENLNKEV